MSAWAEVEGELQTLHEDVMYRKLSSPNIKNEIAKLKQKLKEPMIEEGSKVNSGPVASVDC